MQYNCNSMEMDANTLENEKLSIKNLLFTKAIPNYTLPISIDAQRTFACTDCGDRFIIKSSYEYHITRKSLKISYFCRYCNVEKIFFNRCDLLSHIRSHAFKTATINISDLKIEPLPLSYYKYQCHTTQTSEIAAVPMAQSNLTDQDDVEVKIICCYDCKDNIFSSGIIYRDRAKHYTQYTNKLYSCPICLLALTTQCALQAHLRIHLKEPPYYCCDCGIFLTRKAIVYPYTHDCESFRMMRVSAKLKCKVNSCNKIFHPNESIKHLRSHHLKHVYKCPVCSVACYKLDNIQKHLSEFHKRYINFEFKKLKHIDFLECDMCPGRLVAPGQIVPHLRSHENNYLYGVYPCWTCGAILKLAKKLIEHQKIYHPDSYIEKISGNVSQESNTSPKNLNIDSKKSVSRRRLEKCHKCFKNYAPMSNMQLICKCSSGSTSKIVCSLCQITIKEDWNIIKKHFAIHHREHVCLDVKLLLKKLNLNKYKRLRNISKKAQKINQNSNLSCKFINDNSKPQQSTNKVILLDTQFICRKCGKGYDNKYNLENHIVGHRDPFMAYQCLECGESFIAKPSFSTHLLVKHGINDVNNYIEEKQCYSKDSLNLQKPNTVDAEEPVKENQCNICRDQFSNSIDFEKHFRVHGMAFLKKNTSKSISPKKL